MATSKYPALRDAYLAVEKAMLDDLATPPVTPAPPVVAKWPNSPNWPLILDAPGNALTEWTQILWDFGQPPYVSITQDTTAPSTPPSVLQIKYPTGFQCGSAPGTPYKAFPAHVRQVYVGGWFKYNANWQAHQGSAVSKIFFLFHDSLGDIFLAMYGTQNPYDLRLYSTFAASSTPITPPPTSLGWFVPTAPTPVQTGQWFRVELLIDITVTPSLTSWWINGQLAGVYSGIPFPADGFSEFKLSPTYGGTDPLETKQHDDFLWTDHLHIEGK